jgi:hypothetical protein
MCLLLSPHASAPHDANVFGFPLFLKFQNYVCEFCLLYHCWEFNNSNLEHEKQQQNLNPKNIPDGTTHRYKVGANEYHWLRVVQLSCGFFFSWWITL